MTWLAALTRIPWQVWAALALLIAGTVFGATQCGSDRKDIAAQIEAGNAANDALATAANEAIEAFDKKRATDAAIDEVVRAIQKDNDNATSPDAMRAAIVSGLCGRPTHRDDPACTVQQTNP